ncbi:cilia- and flagella-associated protein 276 [Centropristis striata]|uniref:cilia- and flagella-associated protein 276 n=1 Tax=Centropristis striata TaxID=184440 RepID=UPI0027E099B3|nr:cilia- and flagella-associated protein 276 [Centropristis striata]
MSKFGNSFTQRTFDKPTHLAQTEEPWSRLHDAATLASSLRSVTHEKRQCQVTNDSLDFHLKSVYDHHKDFFWHKNQVLYQRETVSDQHRKQENILEQEQESDIRVWVDPQRRSIYSIK